MVGTVRPRGFESLPRSEVFLPHAQYSRRLDDLRRPDGRRPRGCGRRRFRASSGPPRRWRPSTASRRSTSSFPTRWPPGGSRRSSSTLFGIVALALATLGIYGVIAVATAQRTHEVGLRLALGAAPGDVRWMVVRGAVGLAGAGILIGLLASIPVSRSLASLLVDVTPFDLPTLAAVSSLLLAVAAAAAWSPARRAAATDPLAALRAE